MDVLLYGNGGSGNHGCEAIVRGTRALIDGKIFIHSKSPNEDNLYGLNELAEIIPAVSMVKRDLSFWKAYAKLKFTKNYAELDVLPYIPSIKNIAGKVSLALSVGGDNYCYSDQAFYELLNRAYRAHGFKTVLWGCSVDPEVIREAQVSRDLKTYSVIVARESITFDALCKIGANVILSPDPAFYMQPVKCEIDSRFADGNVVGVNVSPLIISSERQDGITYENYKKLVRYILDCTDMKVALIPHVVWDSNDDRKVLCQLYDDFDQNERIILVEDHSAPELKYIISRCKMFVGARTHATIAAYSSCVPTLVVGYSVKARGIAKDLFGTDEHYVLPVQSLQHADDLTNAFCWLLERETEVRQHLVDFIPGYIESGYRVKEILENL